MKAIKKARLNEDEAVVSKITLKEGETGDESLIPNENETIKNTGKYMEFTHNASTRDKIVNSESENLGTSESSSQSSRTSSSGNGSSAGGSSTSGSSASGTSIDDGVIQGIIVKKKISEQTQIIERRHAPPQPSITTTSPAMTLRQKVATSPTALKSPRSLQFKAQIASPTGSVTNTVTYIQDESIIKGKLSPSEISQNNVRAFARDDEDLEFNEVEDNLTIPDFAYDEIEEEEATDDTIKSLPFSFMPIQKDTPDISTKKSLKPLRTETESVHKEESIHKEETAKESSKMPPPSSSTSSDSGWGNLFSGMKKQWKCEVRFLFRQLLSN